MSRSLHPGPDARRGELAEVIVDARPLAAAHHADVVVDEVDFSHGRVSVAFLVTTPGVPVPDVAELTARVGQLLRDRLEWVFDVRGSLLVGNRLVPDTGSWVCDRDLGPHGRTRREHRH